MSPSVSSLFLPISRCLSLSAWLAIALSVSTGWAQTTVISELLPTSGNPAEGTWVITTQNGNASIGITGLSGQGGNLENNAPGGAGGAFHFQTHFDNSDKATITTYSSFGNAVSVLQNLSISYSYYKATVSGGNAYAAPAIRLTIESSSGTGDNYGQLVYEPYWNISNSATQTPLDTWQTIDIDSSTGGGDGDIIGGWWWTGGFEIDNGAGGPPLRSLDEWVSAFLAADMDFLTGEVTAISIGVGSYNQGVEAYVDTITYSIDGGSNASFSVSPVPEPSSFAMILSAAIAGLVLTRRPPRPRA